MDHRKRQTSRDDAPSLSGGKLHRPAHDAGRCRGGWRSLDRVVSELRTPGRARSIEVAARFTHLRALNGVTDQHRQMIPTTEAAAAPVQKPLAHGSALRKISGQLIIAGSTKILVD